MSVNSIIGCDSLTGGVDALEDVNHEDVFGDGSNVAVQSGDICYVILEGGPSYCYIARVSLSPVTDGYRSVAMLSGGLFVWECQYIADLEEAYEVPRKVQVIDGGTNPPGFVSGVKGYELKPLYKTGDAPSRSYPLMGIWGSFLYLIGGDIGYGWVYKFNIGTGDCDRRADLPSSVYYPAGCQRSSSRYMVFDSYYRRTYEVFLSSSGSSYQMETTPPGVANQVTRGTAVYCEANNKIYLFGGASAGVTVYEYDRTLDDYYTANPAAYTQKADMPGAIVDAGAVCVGDKVYVMFFDSGDIKGYMYDTTLDTWDAVTIPSYVSTYTGFIKHNMYYDPVQARICIVLTNSISYTMKYVVLGYDLVGNVWSVLDEQPFDLASSESSCVYDPTSGLVLHSLTIAPYVVQVSDQVRNMCLEDLT